jgi:hypothetical protein
MRKSPTGRLTPKGPNMAQIPMRTPEVQAIRKAFLGPKERGDFWATGTPRTGKNGAECQGRMKKTRVVELPTFDSCLGSM